MATCKAQTMVGSRAYSLPYGTTTKPAAIFVTSFVAGAGTTIDVSGTDNPAAADWIPIRSITGNGVYPIVPMVGTVVQAQAIPFALVRVTLGGATGTYRLVQEES